MKIFNSILKASSHHRQGNKRLGKLSAETAPSTTFYDATLASHDDDDDDASFASHQTNDAECLGLGVASRTWTFDKNKPHEMSRKQLASLDRFICPGTADMNASFATHDTNDTDSLNLGVATKTWIFDKNSLQTNSQKQLQPQHQQRTGRSGGLLRSDSISQLNVPNTVACEAPSPIKKQKSLRSAPSRLDLKSQVQVEILSDASKQDSRQKQSKVLLSTSCHEKRSSPPKIQQELSKTVHEQSPRRNMTKCSRARPTLSRQPNPFQKQASERFLTRHLQKELSLADVFSQYDKIVDSVSSLSTCLSDDDPAPSEESSKDTTTPKPAAVKQIDAVTDPKKSKNRTNYYAAASLLDQPRPSFDEHNLFQCKDLQDCLSEYEEITHQLQMKGW